MSRKSLIFLSFAVALLVAPATFAQTTHTVQVLDNSFSPASLIIQAGDTVQFVNSAGGNPHNVETTSGPTTFQCGTDGCVLNGTSGFGAAWTASIQLNDEGTINYDCGVHGASMAGTIEVGPVPVELQSFGIE